MGRLTKIQKIINDTISHYAHTAIIPRGLPIYVDQLLRGSIRFGKRVGNNVSMINPENIMKLVEDIPVGSQVIYVDSTIKWLEPDCVITIGPQKELVLVDDIDGNQILLKSRTLASYSAEMEKLALFGVPCYCMVSTSANATSVVIKSKYQLANGDMLSYQASKDLLLSLTDVEVTQVTYLGTTTDPIYNYLYRCDLASPISVALAAQEAIYLRAFPAYFSDVIGVPSQTFSVIPIGPFLIDFTSGNLLEGATYKETISIRTSSLAEDYIDGDLYSMRTVNKNHFILDRPWHSHFPLFWDLAEGTMQLTPSQIVFNVNELNHFCVGYKCVPPMRTDGDKYYRICFNVNENCSIRFYFYPDTMQEFHLVPGANQCIDVKIPGGIDITNIEINILGESDVCQVTMSDWLPLFPSVSNIQYNIVIQALGEAVYQSTSMMIKPYFIDSELLGTRYDIGSYYDTGHIYL